MHVAREYSVEMGRHLRAGDHIRTPSKREIGRTDDSTFNCMMQTQQGIVCGVAMVCTRLQRSVETPAHVLEVGESGECQTLVTAVETIRSWPVEQVDVRMIQEQRRW